MMGPQDLAFHQFLLPDRVGGRINTLHIMGMQQDQSTQMAVALKMAVIAVNEARSINPSKAQKMTLTQTAMTGVRVFFQMRDIYLENGNISSDT
jgi:hypothetical protein